VIENIATHERASVLDLNSPVMDSLTAFTKDLFGEDKGAASNFIGFTLPCSCVEEA
jgi:hypothetical protein